jgi:hypothetical protein
MNLSMPAFSPSSASLPLACAESPTICCKGVMKMINEMDERYSGRNQTQHVLVLDSPDGTIDGLLVPKLVSFSRHQFLVEQRQ